MHMGFSTSDSVPAATVCLTPATPDDSDRLFAIKRAAFRMYSELDGGWDEEEERQRHDARFASMLFRKIVVGESVVGFIATQRRGDALRVSQLMILPEHQGRGYGRDVMLHVLQEANAEGLPVALRVLKVNPRAHEFYRALGFVARDETAQHFELLWVGETQ